MPGNPHQTPCAVPGCRAWALRGSGPPRPLVPMPVLNLGKRFPMLPLGASIMPDPEPRGPACSIEPRHHLLSNNTRFLPEPGFLW
jgi:hypothetical protein